MNTDTFFGAIHLLILQLDFLKIKDKVPQINT